MTPVEPLLAITGFIASFLASALHSAAEKHDSSWQYRQSKKLQELLDAVAVSRPDSEALEVAIAQAFRDIAPIEAYNRFSLLFNDIEFRNRLLTWVFTLDGNDRKHAYDSLQTQAAASMQSLEMGKQAAAIISNAFKQIIHSDSLLSGVLARNDRESLLNAVLEVSHTIDARFYDTHAQLHAILSRLADIEHSVCPDAETASQEICRYTDNVLQGIETSMPILGALDRIELPYVLRCAFEEDAVLVQGEAGSGKTGILARLAQELRAQRECVLFIRADYLAGMFGDRCTVADLSSGLGFTSPLPDLLGRIADVSGRVWLVIDQMDQVAGSPVGAAFVHLIKRVIGRGNCKVVVACRSYEAKSPAFVETLSFPGVTIRDLPPEVVCQCLHTLALTPEGRMVRFCGNVLNLSLLASLVNDGASVSDLSAEGQLWNRLMDRLLQDRKSGLLEAACEFAAQAIKSEGGHVSVMGRQACADRLSSWGILSPRPGGLFGFRHERVRDYFVAYDSVVQREEPLCSLLRRIRSVVHSKNIIPWMLQIAAHLKPEHCCTLVRQAFDRHQTTSHFPRRACIDCLGTIEEPTPQLARALWDAAGQYDSLDDMRIPLGHTQPWALAFWHAGLFDAAARATRKSSCRDTAVELLDNLPLVAQQLPEEVGSWIIGLEASPPDLGGIVEALLGCSAQVASDAAGNLTRWIRESSDRRNDQMWPLLERLVAAENVEQAVSLVDACTEPFLWTTTPKPPHTPHSYLTGRSHDLFRHPDSLEDRKKPERLFGVPCELLIPVFRRHVSLVKKIAGDAGYTAVGDPYMHWGDLRHLFSPGRTDQGEEWKLWYDLLRLAVLGTRSHKPTQCRAVIGELLASSDLLEVRIALEALSEYRRIPQSLLLQSLEMGIWREPAAIGETLRVFAHFLTPKQRCRAVDLAAELQVAVNALDRDRPKFLSLGYYLPKKLVRWAKHCVLSQEPCMDCGESEGTVAEFVLALKDQFGTRHACTFQELSNLCRVRTAVGVRRTGWCVGSEGRYIEATPDCASIDAAADEVRDVIARRMPYMWRSGKKVSLEWIEEPIGYAVLVGLQWRRCIRKPHPEQNERLYRHPSPTFIKDVLDVYGRVVDSPSVHAHAIRSQLAGVLGGVCAGMPVSRLRGLTPIVRHVLYKLATSQEKGCVQSWGNLHHFTVHPPALAAKAVNALLHCAWREQFGDTHPIDLFLERLSRRHDEVVGVDGKCLSEEDMHHIEMAYRTPGAQQLDVIRVLGSRAFSIAVLDPSLLASIVEFVSRGGPELSQAFAKQLSASELSFLLYPACRAVYARLMEEHDAIVSAACLWDMAAAMLLGWEDLADEACALRQVLAQCSDKDRRLVFEIVCDAYDKLGGHTKYWVKVRTLWHEASERSMDGTSLEAAAFWRCLQKGKRSTANTNEKIELRVPERLASLRGLLESTCRAIAFDATYDSERRGAVLRYLAHHSVGEELVTVRLLGMCIDVDGENYDSSAAGGDDSRTILRNAIVAGGAAKEIAVGIIERQEQSSRKSLAGLLM